MYRLWQIIGGQEGGVRPNPRKFRRETSEARFPVTAAIRHDFPYTFGPVLIASLGLRWPVSGNGCFPYLRASVGFCAPAGKILDLGLHPPHRAPDQGQSWY